MLALAIFILGAAGVCASDVNDTAIADADQMELSASNEMNADTLGTSEENTLTQANDCEILGEDESGTFTQLQNEINAAGNELNLTKDYRWTDEFSGTGIVINNSITINGNGHSIDALGKIRIFELNATTGVTLNNITFKNGNTDGCGGAINVWNALSDSKFTNLNFINNTAAGNGGALYMAGASTNNLFENITFENNTDIKNGGALYVAGASTSDTFENVKFVNNTAKKNDGGAINFHAKVDGATFLNVSFFNNRAEIKIGGAINFDNGLVNSVFNNTCFMDNAAKSGGALGITGTISSLAFENTKFIHNAALIEDGGAINIGPYRFSDLANTTFKKVSFINNTAKQDGGALFVTMNTKSNTFEDVEFINNAAKGRNGGAIRFGANTYQFVTQGNSFKMVTFANNTANNNGGALYVTGASTSDTFENAEFVNNTAKKNDGGAINFHGKVDGATFADAIFNNNRAENAVGGAINFDSGLVNSVFNNTCFMDNAAKSGGALGITGTISSLAFENTKFIHNAALIEDGGAINIGPYRFSDLANTTFKKVSFINNTAKQDGGALFVTMNTKSNTFEDVEFINNAAKGRNGGAIRFGANTYQFVTQGNSFKMVTFANNTANNNGGALYVTGEFLSNILELMVFENNTAKTEDGGAINFYKTVKDTTFNEVIFYKNSAPQSRSGAVNCDNGMENSIFNNTIFKENSALLTSVITLSHTTSSNTFKNTQFINNTANAYLMYVNNATSDNIIRDSIFLNNNASKITVKNGNIQLTDNWFGNNATCFDENPNINQTLDNWLFLNATVSPVAITLDQNSTIAFKFYSYDNKTKAVREYDGSASVPLGLYSTLGLLNRPVALINENIVYTPSKDGNGTVTGKYETAYYTVVIENSKVPTVIKLAEDKYDVYVGDTRDNLAVLQDKDGKNITDGYNMTYTSNNESVVKIVNGTFVAVGEGSAVITVSFNGTERYVAAENKTIAVTVSLNDAMVIVDNSTLDLRVGDTHAINATTVPAGLNVTYIPDNSGVVSVDENGTVTALKEGKAVIIVKIAANGVYAENSTEIVVSVSKVPTEIAAADVSTVYNVDKYLTVTLKDENGNPISGVNVAVDLNGAKTYTTDDNGQVKVSTKGLAPKAYVAKITFGGDAKYANSSKDVKVTVKKATPKIVAKSKTFKTTTKTKKYAITLKDNTGKAIKKAKVTLKVKGKTYKATTNSKGKATFKIKKLNKVGTFKAVVKYNGNKYYNKVSKKVKIKVIFKTVSKGSKDKSTVRKIQQALKDHGYYLSYKGRYLMVDGKFSSCTERSVKQFQRDNGLKVTGKVDQKTAKKLGII